MGISAKILIVEDEPVTRDALAFKLIKDGYEVSTAEDGEKAVLKMEDEAFDMIISDIMMPYVSGFELLRILKEKGNQAPILMLTSLNSQSAQNQAMDMGASGYMSKPFNPAELSKRIKALLSEKK